MTKRYNKQFREPGRRGDARLMPFPLFRRNKPKPKQPVEEKDGVAKKQEVVVLPPPLFEDKDDVNAIANETNHLLQRITTTMSPSRKRPRKVVGRVTIEVLDTFPPSARLEEPQNASKTDPSSKENAQLGVESMPPLAPLDTGDAFGFEEEEDRVRDAADIFVPSTIPGKKALEAQVEVLDNEKQRLSRRHRNGGIASMDTLVLPAPEVDNDADKEPTHGSLWRQISDPDRGETWYYNTETGLSQWEPPPSSKSIASSSPLPRLSKGPPHASMTQTFTVPPVANNHDQGVSSLPLLSPKLTPTPFGSKDVPHQAPRHSHPLPALHAPILLQDFDDDLPSTLTPSATPSDPTSSSPPSPSPHDHASPHLIHPNHDAPSRHPDDSADGDMVDWMDDTALFLADGSKNHKLRDTIRDALKVSKFDSVSALLTSSISFNAVKRERYRRPNPLSSPSSSGGSTRDVVLGKKPDTFLVAVLATDKTKKRTTSKQSSASRQLRIRDVADAGFTDVPGPLSKASSSLPPRTSSSSSSSPDRTQCFACWSAIKGCLCDAHTDPLDTRPASESALMCSNWEIDQLRRKYRAEEIQEIFMKANSSLRYDKQRKAYITIVECRHPIYRAVDATLLTFNKTMRRKLHTRAWFRSFLEQLRLGTVSKASPPTLLKLRDTLRNGKWCQAYSDSVWHFHPVAPVTDKSFSPDPILDVIAMNPAAPHALRHWVLKTDSPVPVVLYRPRKYDLLPRRCIPMPQPSFLDQIPLPVPNRYIDGCHKLSWVERVCARQSHASVYRATAQIKACTPSRGFDKPRRTRVTPPTCVLFANFGRKPSPDNMAVGGLVAELLIYLVVTTFVPPQFGNFTVTDRRALCPKTTPDASAVYLCLEIDPKTSTYVVRPLEHALNTRRAPTIVIIVQGEVAEPCLNRPEQTSEEAFFGFRTILEWTGLFIPDETRPVTFVPSGDVLTFNTPSFNATITTRADRYYPFCEPTTRESTIAEFMHLLWMGKSSRNQPQVH
ncbi:hypothetical protein DYB26_010450 [Aphanomyces astaci]|uniref:WW domain-containing protein n=1 Tax=Aphanomyces astaci TaxID=112090 RepID=A0A418E630_APHAT|nr:hypothetical protein DYB26_010450 [Aphanomyces astaci]